MKLFALLILCTDAFLLHTNKQGLVAQQQQQHNIIAMGSSVRNVESFKHALLKAYQSHIKGNSRIAILVDTNVVLTWTDSTQEETIILAINNLPLTVKQECASTRYASILDACRQNALLRETAVNNIYMVMDNVQDSSTHAVAVAAANELVQKKGVKVYPIGIGPCIDVQDLKRIAGPCHPLFGCHAPFAYYQARDYDGIQRVAIEQAENQQHDEKHVIVTGDGLTTTQLVITIVFSVVIGVLAMWCLVYSCCYLPKQIPEYTMWAETVQPTAAPIGLKAGVPSFVSSFRTSHKSHIV